jgi:uncharacterized membrane protein YgdD (TMEM256/DUF423 family)
MIPANTFLVLGALNALLAVSFGAFGSHVLRDTIGADMVRVWETDVHYHCYHAIGLCLIGLIVSCLPETLTLELSGWVMLAGIVLFPGCLFVLAASDVRWLGVITPVGGTAFVMS